VLAVTAEARPSSAPFRLETNESRPTGRLYRRLRKATAEAALPATAAGGVVEQHDIEALPPVVQRYLNFMGVVGRPRDRSFRVRFQGRFRTKPGGPWLPADAWQYNCVNPVRVFVMRLTVGHVLPFYGCDTYLRGRGRLVGTLFGRTVVHGSGAEFDHSEFVIYLNDAVLLAPSMLLGPAITWSEVDQSSFDITASDRGGPATTARVSVDDRGAPVDFRADRYATLPKGIVLAPWHTPIRAWTTDHDRPLPASASVIYELPTGPYCYAEGRFTPGTLVHNLTPDQL
jgi:hypothetical protein